MNAKLLCCVALAGVTLGSIQSFGQDASTRTLKVCVASDAPAEIRAAANQIVAEVGRQPLLAMMAGSKPPSGVTDSKALAAAKPAERAYSHLVLVGMPTDPLIAQAWQRDARVEEDGFYIFGFGHLRGTLGYIESDRNPFLHSAAIAFTPFETEVVTLTGSTPAGVTLAVDAFLKQGLVNGVVAAPGWKRAGTTLLDHDPLIAGFALPADLPIKAGKNLALTQAGEDEYRGVLADTGILPAAIWRLKWVVPGSWDGAGAGRSIAQYLAGLHRRAYGNTLWCARFDSNDQAALAAEKLVAAARLTKKGASWVGGGNPKDPTESPIELWQEQAWVFMSTLPVTLTPELKQGK